jgi:mRNA-degrading endonuclease RelE of RelBE toxin-antitoxin system
MNFSLHVSDRARGSLKRLPAGDLKRILAALDAMRVDPLAGDVMKLKGSEAFRRRVGNYRIIFHVSFEQHFVAVIDVLRRTTTTYR